MNAFRIQRIRHGRQSDNAKPNASSLWLPFRSFESTIFIRTTHPPAVSFEPQRDALLDGNQPRSDLLHEVFEQQAAARPNAVAVSFARQQLTYRELDERANQLARLLRDRGLSRGDCVALWLARSVEVYVALLGILKAGAAYVPLDPDYPIERVQFILSDSQARAVVTIRRFAERLSSARSLERAGERRAGGESKSFLLPPQVICLDEQPSLLDSFPPEKLVPPAVEIGPKDRCYVIYTSGTTGQPKGVEIEHRSVCHLVRTEADIFKVRPSDRVYQGFSVAFDASVEEIWLAFFAGATLVAATDEMVRSGPALSRLLTEVGITVLSCVPTLLAMTEGDIPSLRLLILGGEACPPDLVKRWWRLGRRVVNTYGPTEATVIATFAECHPDKPVTIGRPLPGYTACLLDEQLQPVPEGAPGELCLGGLGLARGYLGRPELTAQKFVTVVLHEHSVGKVSRYTCENALSFKILPVAASPAAPGGAPGSLQTQRLYRTGDFARWTPDGELEFLGRLDGQVKIRGFRVELAEIEIVLLECPSVQAAAVALREDTPGLQQLVAYIVPRATTEPDHKALRDALRARLPAYMVPSLIETVACLPTLPSGKIDRKGLPTPRSFPLEAEREIVPPSTETEQQLATAWAKLFSPMPVSVTDDFFLDLGGHSLLAARLVSELRRTGTFARISMLDIYRHPTVRSLATEFEKHEEYANAGRSDDSGTATRSSHSSVSSLRHFLCGAAQALSLLFILSFFALQWLAPYLTYTVLVEEDFDFLPSIVGAFASLVVLYPLMLAIPILVKWLVIGRYKPGSYPLWGSYYFRWWLVTTIEAAVPVSYLSGTPLLSIYLRLMGARIGRNVHLASDNFAIYDLLSIGDDSTINVDSNLLGYTVEDGFLRIGTISVGKNCFVGARTAVRENTVIEDGAALEDLSLLPRGGKIACSETWAGSPARKITSSSTPAADPCPVPSALRRFGFGVLHGIGLLTFPVLVVAALFPGIVVMNKLNYIDPYYWYLFLSPLVGVSFVLLLALEIAALKWLLLGKIEPGRHRLHTLYYFRRWFVGQTLDLSLDILGPLYASVYLSPWYKLLGARLGSGAEVSTASFISPDLLEIGDESFIADNVSLGAPRVRDGQVTLGRNQVGKRSFIGNSAMLPPGAAIGDEVLIGCLSAPPASPADALREDSAWLGSPAMFLPQRQKSTVFGRETTFQPTTKLRALRAAIEFVRVISPATGFIILLSLMFSILLLLHDSYSLLQTLLFFPPLYLGCGLAAVIFTIISKWLIVGRYQPSEKPLWSTFVWRNELLNALHEHLAEPFIVGSLTGTPFVCWYFRLLGAQIGRRVYMETTDLSEFDLAQIGDEAALNSDCTIQTHLFEDRVMKMSHVRIGPCCHVGAGTLVLYDTCMEKDSSLDDLSLLMKGETLPANTQWQGSPARAAS